MESIKRKEKKQLFHWLLLSPTLMFLGLFLLLPFIFLLVLSFRNADDMGNLLNTYSFKNYITVFKSHVYVKTIISTLWVAFKTTIICIVLAYPTAYLLVKAKSRKLKAMFYILLVSPLLTSIVIRTFAWIVLLSQNGIVNQILLKLHLINHPLSMLWNMTAVIIAYVQVFLPFVVLPISTSLGDIDKNLRNASMSLGAGRISTFLKVTLPLTIPGLIASALIVFSLSAGSYITPLLVGGGLQPLLSLTIYQQVTQVYNLPLAASMAFTLLIAVIIFVGVLGMILKRWEKRLNG